ncbi:helix-turn-helix domain-containing protein [Flavobacteriaceae bacterium R38]|nr:helix-turn-helix domain-containing protein [Flavobacteriaceae bacterium R38]
MQYYLKEPALPALSYFIKNFWSFENDDPTIIEEKIIPDGYPELIFHYKDPYQINIKGHWELQANYLIAGQIRNHFHLKNTGSTGIFGIKMQPTALQELFGLEMDTYTDQVFPFSEKIKTLLQSLISIAISSNTFDNKVASIESWFEQFIQKTPFKKNAIHPLVSKIIASKGLITVNELKLEAGISERSLERRFKTAVGISGQLYIKIIRFSHIFKTVKEHSKWADVAYLCGYYDQSHFIKNFKEFTGENPSAYGFDKKTMANFFLVPPKE